MEQVPQKDKKQEKSQMKNFIDIRQNSENSMLKNGIPCHPNLPLLDFKRTRSSTQVADKIISLYCLAGVANGADGGSLLEWLTDSGSLSSVDVRDREILKISRPSKKLLNELSWKQESLYTLCWIAGIVNDMTWPDRECDLSEVFSEIPPEIQIEDFKRSLSLRADEVVVEVLDLYYCLNASLMHPELWSNRDGAKGLKIEVVLERRQALEWACSEGISWEEISLNT